MPYRSKFCNQCADKIEWSERRFWHSERFCQLCATDFWIYEWMPYIKGSGLVLGVLLISFFFQKPDKSFTVASNQFVSSVNANKVVTNQNTATQFSNDNTVQRTEPKKSDLSLVKQPVVSPMPEAKTVKYENADAQTSEKTYFCGAATKKGTPCSRRVRGGGRCWQHAGQPAMLAQDKLIAGQ